MYIVSEIRDGRMDNLKASVGKDNFFFLDMS